MTYIHTHIYILLYLIIYIYVYTNQHETMRCQISIYFIFRHAVMYYWTKGAKPYGFQ